MQRQENVMAPFCCHGNSDVNKTWIITSFHHHSAAVVTFFRYICYCRRGKGSKWGSILPQKSSRATLKELLTSFIRQHCTLETTTLTLRFHRLFDSLYTCSKSD